METPTLKHGGNYNTPYPEELVAEVLPMLARGHSSASIIEDISKRWDRVPSHKLLVQWASDHGLRRPTEGLPNKPRPDRNVRVPLYLWVDIYEASGIPFQDAIDRVMRIFAGENPAECKMSTPHARANSGIPVVNLRCARGPSGKTPRRVK